MKNLFLFCALLSTIVLTNCKPSNSLTSQDTISSDAPPVIVEDAQEPTSSLNPQGPAGSHGSQGPQGPAGSQGPQGPGGSYDTEAPQGPAGQRGPASVSSPYASSTDQEMASNAESTASQLHLRIKRIYREEKCIIGKIYRVSHHGSELIEPLENFLAYTLELPYTFNFQDISSIPPGTYNGDIRTDGARGWRIELKDVPDRTLIQIHVGNYPKNTTGCILLGTEVKDNDAQKCTLLNSKKAMNNLETDFIVLNALLGLNRTCPALRVKLEFI